MITSNEMICQATGVSIGGRGLIIQGPPGAGKSSLALTLIDRGGILIGDDSLILKLNGQELIASPHPRTRGLLEVRNLGLLPYPCADVVSVALFIALDPAAPRYIEEPERTVACGLEVPLIRLRPEIATLALKAELALLHYGVSQ